MFIKPSCFHIKVELLSDAHLSSLKVSHPRSWGNSFPSTFFWLSTISKIFHLRHNLTNLKTMTKKKTKTVTVTENYKTQDLKEIYFHWLSLQFLHSTIWDIAWPTKRHWQKKKRFISIDFLYNFQILRFPNVENHHFSLFWSQCQSVPARLSENGSNMLFHIQISFNLTPKIEL